jgi:hypothetical protein
MVGSRCMTDSFEARSDLADLSGRLGRLRMSAHAGMSMLPLTGHAGPELLFAPPFPDATARDGPVSPYLTCLTGILTDTRPVRYVSYAFGSRSRSRLSGQPVDGSPAFSRMHK